MPWPSDVQFLQIANTAKGVYVFAEVIIRFIQDSQVGNPVAQLKYVLAAVDKLQKSPQSSHPLAPLDAIYTAILDKVPDNVIDTTKDLLQIMVFLRQQNIDVPEFNFRDMYNYLDVPQADAVTALRHLHSVVFFPRVLIVDIIRPRFYHASFQDYLEDPYRSGKYAIEQQQIVAERFTKFYFSKEFGTLINSPLAFYTFQLSF
jgi:hypothetical protein